MPKDVVIHVQTLIQNSQNSRFLRFEPNGHTGFLRLHGIVFEFEHTFVLSFAYIEYFFITRIDKGINIMSESILHGLRKMGVCHSDNELCVLSRTAMNYKCMDKGEETSVSTAKLEQTTGRDTSPLLNSSLFCRGVHTSFDVRTRENGKKTVRTSTFSVVLSS